MSHQDQNIYFGATMLFCNSCKHSIIKISLKRTIQGSRPRIPVHTLLFRWYQANKINSTASCTHPIVKMGSRQQDQVHEFLYAPHCLDGFIRRIQESQLRARVPVCTPLFRWVYKTHTGITTTCKSSCMHPIV